MNVLLIQLATLAPFVLLLITRWIRDAMLWRRMIQHYLPQPIANLTPPTVAELQAPAWLADDHA